MNTIITSIKLQYFSIQNIDFLTNIIRVNYNIKDINYQDKLFKIQNKVYNSFFETIHNKSKRINDQPNILDDILIELNKLTIQFYLTPQKIQDNIQSEIPSDITDNIQSEIQNNIQSEIQNNIQSEIQNNIQPEIQNNGQPEIQNNIQPEIQNNIQSEIQNNIQPEIQNNGQPEIQNNIQSEIQNNIQSEIQNNIQSEIQNNIQSEIQNNISDSIYLDLYSSSSKYNQLNSNEYQFILSTPLRSFYIKQFKIYSNDTFNNINEYNNKIDLIENKIKVKIIIPPGKYNIQELITILYNKFNEKSAFKSYNITYDINKNNMCINCDKNFNIKFIENENDSVQLKNILGYSKNEYCSSNSYISENQLNINIHNEIYVKVKDESLYTLNKFHTNINFKYFYKYNYDINNINEFILHKPVYNITLQLYYKSDNKLFKFIKKVDYNILLKTKT